MRRLMYRLRALFRTEQMDRELEDELDYHFAKQVERNVARGMDVGSAAAAARVQLGTGDHVREATRDARGVGALEDLLNDLRFAARTMRRSPLFTIMAVSSLAVGIGAGTTIFNVIDGLMLRRLDVPAPEELVFFREHQTPDRHTDNFPYEEFQRLRVETNAFAAVAAVHLVDRSNVRASGGGIDPARVRVAVVSGDYFKTLGVDAAQGRALGADDDRVQHAHPVVVISDAYWKSRFARAPDVLTRTITMNDVQYSVVGVLPPSFAGEWVGRPADLFVPSMMSGEVMFEEPGLLTQRNAYAYRVLARLRPGVSAVQAQTQVQSVYQRIWKDWSGPGADAADLKALASQHVELVPAGKGYSPQRESSGRAIMIVALVVVIVLLLSCVNVASLLLARAVARQREFAVRAAIGAGSGRLVRQLLTESLLLSGLAGLLAVPFAVWATRGFARILGTSPVQTFWAFSSWISFDFHMSARALLLTTAICITSGLLFGLAPAVMAARRSLAGSLSGRGATQNGSRFRLGKSLVIGQVALSLVVLVAASLLVVTLRNLRTQPLGFQRNRVLLVWMQPSGTRRTGPALTQLWGDVQRRIASVPGVTAASASNQQILSGNIQASRPIGDPFIIPGQEPRPSTAPFGRVYTMPGFFRALNVPILAGRDFTEADSARHVMIINETMARHYFGLSNPTGRVMRPVGDTTNFEVVGVAKDFELTNPRNTGNDRRTWFLPYVAADAGPRISQVMVAVVQFNGDRNVVAQRIQNELSTVDASLPVLRIDTIEEQLDDVLTLDRLLAGIAGFFGFVSLLLVCLGLYGVISYTTSQRTSEIGVRAALGASRHAIATMVLREALALVAAGVVIGLPAALAVSRIAAPRLFGVTATHPAVFAAAIGIMTAVATGAGFLPARRASRVDPLVALQHE